MVKYKAKLQNHDEINQKRITGNIILNYVTSGYFSM
jgi:hypothetical protein